jgi:tripartite-type tricarboxylate transporter receptor subunit TctC
MHSKCSGSCASAAFVAAVLATAAPTAASAADFYAGKTIDFLVGGDVGGGYDIYARLIGRHLPRFIPGQPAIVPKNQPGAGSGRAAAYLFSVAPKDGTMIGAVFPGAIMSPLLDERAQPLFDPAKFQYLASADNATRVCITHERSKIRSFEDAQRQKAILGASAAGGSTRDYVNMHKKTAGALFELVSGYKGTADILLAVERGEVDGLCGLDWSSLKSQRPDWVRNKTVNILLQVNLEPEAELTRLGVPQAWKYIKSEDDRKAVELVVGQQVFGRPYLAPPGVPAEQVRILRAAFAAAMADKDFLAEAERTRIDVVPSTGEEVQQLVERIYATPKPIVERAKELVRP